LTDPASFAFRSLMATFRLADLAGLLGFFFTESLSFPDYYAGILEGSGRMRAPQPFTFFAILKAPPLTDPASFAFRSLMATFRLADFVGFFDFFDVLAIRYLLMATSIRPAMWPCQEKSQCPRYDHVSASTHPTHPWSALRASSFTAYAVRVPTLDFHVLDRVPDGCILDATSPAMSTQRAGA
jgi:hypothetical protein